MRLLLIFLLIAITGCTQDLQQLQDARTRAAATLNAAQIAHDRIEQQLTTRPADDPVRKQLEPKLADLDTILSQMRAYLPILDGAIKSAGTGPIDPAVQQAVSAIPYGSVALALVGVAFGVMKHLQAGTLTEREQETQRAFEQIVSAMDAAFPKPSADQQAKLEGVLDTDVKAKVAAIRST